MMIQYERMKYSYFAGWIKNVENLMMQYHECMKYSYFVSCMKNV